MLRPTPPPPTTAPWRRDSPVLKPDFRRGKPAPNKGKEYPAIALTRDDVKALVSATPRKGPRGKRDRALIAVLYRGALRIGEALALYESDLNAAAGTIRVRHGKGDRPRTVGLDPDAWAYVDAWIAERRRLGISGHRPLFCTVVGAGKGRPLQRSVWTTSLHRLARRAGLEKRVTSHTFRHTWTFEYHVLEGGPILLAQKQLGHARIDTTVRYADKVAPADLVAAMQRRRWHVNGNGDGAAAGPIAAALAVLAQPGAAEALLELLGQGPTSD